MIFDKRYIFASSVKSKMLSQMLLLFSFFTSHISAKLVAFFHFIHIIKTGRFKYCLFLPFKYFVFCGKKWFSTKDIFSLLQWKTKCCLRCYFFFPFSPHMFPQNWLLFFMWYVSSKLAASIVAFFCLLSILCFVAKNDFRQKIYLHFFCEVQNAVLDVTSFFSLINSRVSSLGCFFSRHMFPQKWLLFSPHMFHQNWLLFFTSTITTKRQWVSLHVFSFGFHFDLGLSFQSTSISVSISVFKFDLSFDLGLSFQSTSISVSISVFSFDFSFDFSFSSRSQYQNPVSQTSGYHS